MLKRLRDKPLESLFAVIVALHSCKILMALHVPNMAALAGASLGVVEGKPEWVAFQNRLLGPYLVFFIAKVAGLSYTAAWKVFTLLLMFAEGLLVHGLLVRRPESRDSPLRFLVIFQFVLLSLQNYWFYTWDSIDLLVFILFAYGVVFQTSLAGNPVLLAVLFVVALINRESAIFISVYMMIDAFGYDPRRRLSLRLQSAPKLIAGTVLTVAGIAYTRWVRSRLFVDRSADAAHQAIGNHFNLVENIQNAFFRNLGNERILNTVAFLAILWYFGARLRAADRGDVLAVILSVIILVNNFFFGVFNETRIYFILMPFLFFLWLKQQKIEPSATRRNTPEPAAPAVSR